MDTKTLIYISHWRFPSEKTMSPLIMKTCEEFSRQGLNVELWIPRRRDKAFNGIDPYKYHNVSRNFTIRRLPVLDLMDFPLGKLWFLIMVLTFNISVAAYALFRRLCRKAVFYVHDLRDVVFLIAFCSNIFIEIHDFYKSSVNFINRWCFKRAKGLVVTNKIKIDILHKEFNIPLSRMLHKPNAVDVPMFDISVSKEEARRALRLQLDKRLVFYTGHLFGWKGVDTLLEASKFLSNDAMIYFVGGTDEDIQAFKIKRENLRADNVVIFGRRPHEEIPLWFRAADVLVLPNTAKDPASKYETSPVKLFEYMASGRPIVASDLPSIRNVVDETMVWFFEPDNSMSLSEVIRSVLSRASEAEAKATVAKEEVKQYTWLKRIEDIRKFISNFEF